MAELTEKGQKLVNLIEDKLALSKGEATPEATFTDLGADSLDMAELIWMIEGDFGIKIPDADAEKLVTVGDAIRYIEQHG